jgi:hypothetical protein
VSAAPDWSLITRQPVRQVLNHGIRGDSIFPLEEGSRPLAVVSEQGHY